MADDGYLIGYEDSSGNFVEVGRFNNLSGNTSDPVFIEHTGSGTRMELDGSGFDMGGDDITGAGSVSATRTAPKIIDPPRSDVSISSNTISADGSYLYVDNGDGTDLQTINNPNNVRIVYIRPNGTFTVDHSADNIFLQNGSNVSLSGGSLISLFYDGSNWLEVGRHN